MGVMGQRLSVLTSHMAIGCCCGSALSRSLPIPPSGALEYKARTLRGRTSTIT
ncbi:hypothetical protein TorRG33x02_335530, partial [Trema orientale]